jgi:transposase
MAHLFWLSDTQWAAIEPHLPKNHPGARCVDDRRVISGIIHVLKTGCRWCDCPQEYGLSTTVYNRFNRWSRWRFWLGLLKALATSGAVTRSTAIDSTYVKALGRPFALHLTAGNVSDIKAAPVLLVGLTGARYVLADKGYDANALRKMLRSVSIVPVISGRQNRKRAIAYDKQRYRDRHLIENAFCRIKDFRRVATRYDKLARNFLSAVALAALVAFWL